MAARTKNLKIALVIRRKGRGYGQDGNRERGRVTHYERFLLKKALGVQVKYWKLARRRSTYSSGDRQGKSKKVERANEGRDVIVCVQCGIKGRLRGSFEKKGVHSFSNQVK